MLHSSRYLTLCLLAGLLACNSNNRDPVADAKFRNEQRIADENVTERQEKDAEFLVEAATHNRLELEMARLAQTKATRPELKTFAQQLQRDHTSLDASLQTLARQKNIALPEGLGGDQEDTYKQLAGLTGAGFDQQYVETLADAHEDAYDSFDEMKDDAYDGDIRAFAAKYAPTLREHRSQVQQLRNLLKP